MGRDNRDGTVDLSDFAEMSGLALAELLELKRKPIDAVPTPLPSWNRCCRDFAGGIGLARGWHVTIGANTGNGKSVLSLNLAHQAAEHGERVGFVSLEMFWTQLATRYMAIVSGQKVGALEPGSGLDVKAHRQAARAVEELGERTGGTLYCNQRHISSLDHILSAIMYLHECRGCRMVIVDYMQLAKVTGLSDRLEAVTQISGGVRGIGQELQIVTVGLSQFNRETSKDYEHPPTPQGLMGGSPLENDSDQVMLIDHTSYRRNNFTNSATQKFILGKNRHGPCGIIDCAWDYNTLRVREIAPVFAGPAPDRGEAYEPDELPLEGVA